jgi:hypothetical protein
MSGDPIIVAGHKDRDRWMKAVCLAGGSMTLLGFRVAMRLALYHNCTTGRCNPGNPKLATAVGATIDAVRKECRKLEADEWIRRKPSAGGSQENKTQIDLLMTNVRGFTADPRVTDDGGSERAVTGVQKQGGRGSIADSLMNTDRTLKKNTEGRLTACPSDRAVTTDRESHLEEARTRGALRVSLRGQDKIPF